MPSQSPTDMTQKAPHSQPRARRAAASPPSSSTHRYPAAKLSPAPTVSTASTGTAGDHEGPLAAARDDDLRRAELAERPRCLDRVVVAARHDRELILVEED